MKGLEEQFRKNPIQKIEKTVKNKVKLPHLNKTTNSEKANFCSNTLFLIYFIIRANKIYAAKTLAFLLHFHFRHDQNHHSNLTSKLTQMCEQISKKGSAPIKIKFFELKNIKIINEVPHVNKNN